MNIEEIIIKRLSEEHLSEEESAFFDKWYQDSSNREYYNYLKHRAIFHTPSLGDNSNIGIIEWPTLIREKDSGTEMISYRIPLIARTELDMNELSDLLIKFDKNFVGICEYFFDIIIPRDYVTARKFKIESYFI